MNGSNEYYQRARNFLKVNPGMAVAVHTAPEVENVDLEKRVMVDWFTYFVERDLQCVLATCERILAGQGKGVTFPCDNPEIFDPSYVTPRHKWHKVERQGGTRTRDIAAIHQRTVAALKAAKPRGTKQVPERDRSPVKSPDEWLDDYRANPPPIPVFSDEFRARYRLPARGAEAAE